VSECLQHTPTIPQLAGFAPGCRLPCSSGPKGVGVAACLGNMLWMCTGTANSIDLSPLVNTPVPVFVSNRNREYEAPWDVSRGPLKVPSLPAFT
jgi:hypothetical protein